MSWSELPARHRYTGHDDPVVRTLADFGFMDKYRVFAVPFEQASRFNIQNREHAEQ
jgi:hypothetical protein